MIGYVRQVSPFELASFRRNPGKIREMLDEETLGLFPPNARAAIERMQQIRSSGQRDSSELRQLGARLSQEMQKQDLLSRDDEKSLSLEKSWHVLHYLLTGTAGDAPPPLGNAILGGKKIGGDVGYGPARFLTPAQVREVAEALAATSKDELIRRYDVAAMERAKIYTFRGEDVMEDGLYYFDKLAEYYAEAAELGNGVLLYIR
jgi:hypothetical protein